METTTAFETDISLLPRTAKACKDARAGETTCFCCAKPFSTRPAVMVMTEQGGYLVGPECAKKCIKAGFEIEANWE